MAALLAAALSAAGAGRGAYAAKLAEPLAFRDEFVEVTEAGALRRRYRVYGDYEAEVARCKEVAQRAAAARGQPPRTLRFGCVFLKDAAVTCPDAAGADGQALRASFTTPQAFESEMRQKTARQVDDFLFAFSGGAVRAKWLFVTLEGLSWTAPGKAPAWGCQPRAISNQVEAALSRYRDAKVDMWVWCAGAPQAQNGGPKQKVGGPPYGISYTQWPLYGGYSIVICAPHLPLIIHEFNHRYLDNLPSIEGLRLTQFHGLSRLGYEAGDLGYPDLLATYRGVCQHVVRPAMWRRFSLDGPPRAKPELFAGKAYAWAEVADDCWFRLPLLAEVELARIIGLTGLKIIAPAKERWRHFVVPEGARAGLLSPYVAEAADGDAAPNNLLSLATESCAALRTATGHWLIVRPEVADVFAEAAGRRGGGAPLTAYGWLNDGVNPLVVLRAPAELAVPAREIGYFRP